VAPLVPYHHSGHALARACLAVVAAQRTANTIGLILAYHGVVAFGDDARSSYEHMLELVTRAETYLKTHGAWEVAGITPASTTPPAENLGALRAAIDAATGAALHMHVCSDAQCLAFARRADLAKISQQGPATPQHAVYTKRVPMITPDVPAYAAAYRDYLDTYLGREASARMDAAPRILLDPQWGLCAFGRTAHEARLAADMYRHDIDIISRASAHGSYRAAPPAAIAQAEYEYGGFALPAP
jgi:rhamnose utilization protein RhaD (predicted bifunctional aldolase and dehydrogenase)